jgi:hypothetical protein
MSVHSAKMSSRVMSVTAGTMSTKHTIFVGNEAYQVTYAHPGRRGHAGGSGAMPDTLVMLLCLLVGFASAIATSYFRFQWPDLAFANADANIDMAVRGGFSLAICGVVSLLMRLGRPNLVMVIGVVFGTVLFHNLVHLAPEKFAVLSQDWVTAVMQTTQPRSIFWPGNSLVF